MQLARFSPAEVLILQRTHQAPVRHMLRLTFADLILRGVLDLENRPFQASPHDAPAPCYYVRPGAAAPGYQPRPHERPLVQVLPEGRQMVLLRHYVKMLLEALPGPHRFRVLVTESSALRGCILRNGWHKILQQFTLTNDGYALRAALDQETAFLTAQLASPESAAAQLPQLFGNALLVGAPSPPELHLFDQELRRRLRERYDRGYVGGWDAGGSGPGDAHSPEGGGDFGGAARAAAGPAATLATGTHPGAARGAAAAAATNPGSVGVEPAPKIKFDSPVAPSRQAWLASPG
ncbi:hypothetical protein [Hymenobacter sp. B81]|uniref:hypothetical protein n=1 Tax=Hymenobacter sp. B81 TaxID=3344878 RepID=UPI0037DCF010